MRKALLTISPFSRPGTKLKSVEKIVVHCVKNPSTTARQNRGYFEGLKKQKKIIIKDGRKVKNPNLRYAGYNYLVDDIEDLYIIPESEMAYHAGANQYTKYGLMISSYPNIRTLSVGYCHPDESEKPSSDTYKRLVNRLAKLCVKHDKDPMKDICRHYDITLKDCPKFFVKKPLKFRRLKKDVKKHMRGMCEKNR